MGLTGSAFASMYTYHLKPGSTKAGGTGSHRAAAGSYV